MTGALATSGASAAADEDVVTHPTGWWGMAMLVVTEGTVFLGLLSAYFFVRASSPAWPQDGIAAPPLGRISVFTVVLLASSLPLFVGEAAIRRGDVRRLQAALAVSFVLGLAFMVNQVVELGSLEFRASDDAYASLFVVITGLHGLHLLAGLVMSAVVQAKVATGRVDRERHLTVTVFALYWHFVDVVWVFVFGALYLSVRW